MSLLTWLDHRTGYRAFIHEALYERIPGGARWRYVWGSTLVFAFFVQVITGIFLWMSYSPSAQTASTEAISIASRSAEARLFQARKSAAAIAVLISLPIDRVVISAGDAPQSSEPGST